MHKFLRAVGYSILEHQEDIEDMMRLIVQETGNRQFIRKDNSRSYAEYRSMVSESIGVCVCGEEDARGKFHVTHYFPFCNNDLPREEEFVVIEKKIAGDGYTGLCDDESIGSTIIFYLQNAIDYLFKHKEESSVEDVQVHFSALSTKANIILPTVAREETLKTIRKNLKKEKLIEEAKNGDEKAIVSLSMEDIDKYAIISERVKKEDILSIVETSLFPLGSESDFYTMIGNIKNVRLEKNRFTGEEVYVLLIEMNTILVNVAINKKDLYGEPEVGRRFRGNVWLQGKVYDVASYL